MFCPSLIVLALCYVFLPIQVSLAHQEILASVITKDLNDVRKELIKADIIPNVIEDFEPQLFLSVKWPSDKTASLGNVISPTDVNHEPRAFLYKDASSELESVPSSSPATFTLAMTDPDAPSRDDPKWAEFCHWIVTGIPITASTSSSEGLKDIMSYQPPTPPSKTGLHRYIFLVFAPRNKTDSANLHLSKPGGRKRWGTGKKRHGVKDWARENELIPIAANYIFVQNEEQ